MVGDDMRKAFLDHVCAPAQPAFQEDDDALALALLGLLEQAIEVFEPFDVTAVDFAAHVAAIVPDTADLALLQQLRAADLYLACACAHGEPRALQMFDHAFGRDLDLAISRSGNANLSQDEFRQLLRNKLFVAPPEKRPKIAYYAGRGDLRNWVRVTAVRTVVDIVRQQSGRKEIPVDEVILGAVPSPQEDPEIDYIQRIYKNEFKDALTQAFSALSPRERNLLRHHVFHGLNIDQVGALYHVHRTTAFRWIEKARKALLRETKVALMNRLRLGETGEFTSIMRVVQGDLNLSIRHILVSEIEDEAT